MNQGGGEGGRGLPFGPGPGCGWVLGMFKALTVGRAAGGVNRVTLTGRTPMLGLKRNLRLFE